MSATRHAVAIVGEIAEGGRKIVRLPYRDKEIELGLFHLNNGRYVAYRNICPHAGAPVCVGKVCGTTLPSAVYEYDFSNEKKVLRCPWHNWEFDLLTGHHLVDEKMVLRGYPVETGGETGENLEAYPVETDANTIYILL